jgi:hypothetical protein
VTQAEQPSLPNAIVRAGLALIPGIGGAVAELWDYAQQLDQWRVQQMGEAAREALDDDEKYVQRLHDDDRLLEMLVTAGDAARRTSWRAKRITMGRVLAHAMADDAVIDGDSVLLAAIATLEAVDFQWLGKLIAFHSGRHLGALEIPEPYASRLIGAGVVGFGPVVPRPGPGGYGRLSSLTQRMTPDFYYGITGPTDFGIRLAEWVKNSSGADVGGDKAEFKGEEESG